MKNITHSNRRSYRKWSKPGQLTGSITTQAHRDATRNQRKPAYGGMARKVIAYGPRVITSRGVNRYAENDVRPKMNDIRRTGVSIRRGVPVQEYGMNQQGMILRLRPKSWCGKSERREVIKSRREDREAAKANI